MELILIDADFTVCKLNDAVKFDIDLTGDWMFLSKTPDELSLVCASSCLPAVSAHVTATEKGWKALRISGTLDFGLIGIIANIARILADARVGIFVVSTYDTDYIFLKEAHLEKGIQALTAHGYIVRR